MEKVHFLRHFYCGVVKKWNFCHSKNNFLKFDQRIKWSYRPQGTIIPWFWVFVYVIFCFKLKICHLIDHITSWTTFPNDQNPNDWWVRWNIYFVFKTKYNTNKTQNHGIIVTCGLYDHFLLWSKFKKLFFWVTKISIFHNSTVKMTEEMHFLHSEKTNPRVYPWCFFITFVISKNKKFEHFIRIACSYLCLYMP